MERFAKICIALTILTALAFSIDSHAQSIDTSTRIFNDNFKTLKTQVEDNFMAPPIIRLGSNDRLIINFDEIGEENSYLEYRLIHCNADWQPSRLIDSEFVSGFNSQRIEDFAYSYSTYVHFVNYQIILPNDDMQILHSGNYLLQVYDPDEPDDVLLQTRFQVSELLASVSGDVTSRTDRGHNSEWQQVALNISAEPLGNFNPYQDIFIDINRNMQEITQRRIQTPYQVAGRNIRYEHIPDLIFPASNEFRRFESSSNSFPGMNVDRLAYVDDRYHVWIKPDRPRTYAEYSYDRTQHGRFMVREYNSTNSDLAADYITVHFLLEMPELRDTEIYVDGEFNHGNYTDWNRMHYDPEARGYVAEIPLKQGAYNYQYVSRPAGSESLPSPEPLEGNKYETGNEYDVTVYYRPAGARADRIIGFGKIEN